MTQTGLRGGLVAGWRVFGNGPRPALALHAGLASSRAWTPVADQLGGVLTITAPDLPGHGQTARVEAGRGYVGPSTEFAEGFLDVRMDLIGHSVGAVIALDLACRYPQRVRTLTLIEPVLFAAARGTPSYKAHRSAMSGAARAWAEGNRVDAARLFVGQ